MIGTHGNGERLIEGAFYQGAYGPTIIMKVLSREAVDWLAGVFMDLAEHSDACIELTVASGVHLEAVSLLKLQRVDEQPDVALKQLADVTEGAEFAWSQDAENWRTSATLLTALLDRGSGHQYLTHEGKDAALIEISFEEPSVHSS